MNKITLEMENSNVGDVRIDINYKEKDNKITIYTPHYAETIDDETGEQLIANFDASDISSIINYCVENIVKENHELVNFAFVNNSGNLKFDVFNYIYNVIDGFENSDIDYSELMSNKKKRLSLVTEFPKDSDQIVTNLIYEANKSSNEYKLFYKPYHTHDLERIKRVKGTCDNSICLRYLQKFNLLTENPIEVIYVIRKNINDDVKYAINLSRDIKYKHASNLEKNIKIKFQNSPIEEEKVDLECANELYSYFIGINILSEIDF